MNKILLYHNLLLGSQRTETPSDIFIPQILFKLQILNTEMKQ